MNNLGPNPKLSGSHVLQKLKKSRMGRRVGKTKKRRRIFPYCISNPATPLFVGTESSTCYRSVLFRSVVRRPVDVVFAAWKHHYSAWEKRADGRGRYRAGHVVMTDDQLFDLMNGGRDSLWRASERTQN